MNPLPFHVANETTGQTHCDSVASTELTPHPDPTPLSPSPPVPQPSTHLNSNQSRTAVCQNSLKAIFREPTFNADLSIYLHTHAIGSETRPDRHRHTNSQIHTHKHNQPLLCPQRQTERPTDRHTCLSANLMLRGRQNTSVAQLSNQEKLLLSTRPLTLCRINETAVYATHRRFAFHPIGHAPVIELLWLAELQGCCDLEFPHPVLLDSRSRSPPICLV